MQDHNERNSTDAFPKSAVHAGISIAGLVGSGLLALTLIFTPGAEREFLPRAAVESPAGSAMASEPAPVLLAARPDVHPLEPAPGIDSQSNETLLFEPYRLDLTVEPGDTLAAILTGAGFTRKEAHEAIQSMRDVFDPRRLKPGQNVEVEAHPATASSEAAIARLTLHPDAITNVVVERATDGENTFLARLEEVELTEAPVRTDGRIDTSLYKAAMDAGVPIPVLGEMIQIFSFDIDFQREIQPNDRFALMYEEMQDKTGQALDFGDILVAEMTVSGERHRLYRFTDEDGFVDFYDESGQSVRKALMRTPVDGARISSRFGKRKHPVLGYTKLHKGLDFAAPTGTPIYAAGDGVVEVAGRNGGYGNYIRLRHNGTYKTAYAHLSKIDSRVKPGKRVKQRQIIGYVGTTGRSTGPHLHYEVLKAGHQVNPLGIKLPTGKKLKGSELAAFKSVREELDRRYAATPSKTRLAGVSE